MGHTLHRDQRKTSVPASGSSTKSHKGEVPYCCEADRCRRDKTGILCLHEGIISSPTGRGYQVGNCISDVSLFGLSGDLNYSRINAGVAAGASGQSLRPAVRVVAGILRCIKSGVKNGHRGSRLRSRTPNSYCHNKKTGVKPRKGASLWAEMGNLRFISHQRKRPSWSAGIRRMGARA